VNEYVKIAVSLATDRRAYDAYKSLFDVEAWRRQIGDIANFTRFYEESLLAISKRDGVTLPPERCAVSAPDPRS
jgi:hypothetical protein